MHTRRAVIKWLLISFVTNKRSGQLGVRHCAFYTVYIQPLHVNITIDRVRLSCDRLQLYGAIV